MVLISCASEPQPAAQKADPDEEEWIQLFNGEDLNDWQIKINGYDLGDNYENTFRVEDGKMTVGYEGYEDFGKRYGHIFYKEPFSYYHIVVEYRFTGEQAPGGPGWALRNSGIMVHGQPPETMGKDQEFPISIEVQLLGGNGTDERPTANLCTPGTNVVIDGELITQHCTNSPSPTFHGEQWVRAEVKVLGNESIEHIVNGETVMRYESPQIGGSQIPGSDPDYMPDGTQLSEGSISLQSESHPIEFRKVELLPLKGCMDESALNYKSYYVADDPSACEF
jgi:hypothetical protein